MRDRVSIATVALLLRQSSLECGGRALSALSGSTPLWPKVSGPIPAGSLLTIYARRGKGVEDNNLPVAGIREFVRALESLSPEEPVVGVVLRRESPWVAAFLSPMLDRAYGCLVGDTPVWESTSDANDGLVGLEDGDGGHSAPD